MDIAQIGFKVDSSDLDKAVTKLQSLRPAAAAAAGAADGLAAAVEAAATGIEKASVAVAKSEQSKADAVVKAAKASADGSKTELAAAVANKKHADAALAVAKAERDKSAATKASVAAAMKTEAAAKAVAAAYKQQTLAAKGLFSAPSANRNAFNTASGARGPAGGPAAANDGQPNRFNTSNIAAQFQDIGVTAAMGMNPMTIALQQGTQLSAILQTMESPLKGIAVAFGQIFNSISLLTIGLVAVVAAGLQLVNWTVVCKAAVRGVADVVQYAGPYILAFAAALMLASAPAIINGLQSAVMWIGRVGVAAISSAASMVSAWLVAIGPIGWIILAIAGLIAAMNVFRDNLKKIFGVDLVAAVKEWINTSIGLVVGLGEGIIAVFKSIPDVIKGSFSDSGTTMADAFMTGFNKGLHRDYVGAIAKTVTDGTAAAAKGLRGIADKINFDKKPKGKTDAQKFSDVVTQGDKTLATLKAEQAELGLTSIAAAKLKYETELLNDAREKGLKLSPQQRAELGALAGTMATVAEQTRKTKEAIDFAKDATKGFFSDMKSGLQQGEGLWKSFGNAVMNVLNKIIDKLIDQSIDQAFQGAGGGGGITGFLASAAKWLFSAKGNAFGGDGVMPFAKGGAFTNSVVSKPTMFAFGSGGQFGVMGEKGPEAVMPLSRGSDGSLGVRVSGGSQGGGVVVNVINRSANAKTTQQRRQTANGMEIDVMIDDVVGTKLGDRGSSTSRSLANLQNQSLIRR